ncbi:MAG: AAA family ATPase, partial [Deltaproteobacteria bacterium]|nr:AAA family ATPase [Deltaproteobacteria bacterium]
TSYFGFKENPFSLTPDPNYLYLSPHHKEAFDHLLYGINERKGFIVITGGIGTGKTTLCRALLGALDSSIKTALIFNACISDMELLRTINQEFGVGEKVPGQSKKDHIDSLNQFLLDTFSRGGNAVLLIDEAQNLSHTVLEQIRMLSNLETEKEKLVQIVLVGQSELRELLTAPSLKQLDERIMVRYDLKPLDKKDVQGYVEHRLVVAGGKGNVRFTKGALEAIYAYSQGNPRRINGVCDRALLIAYSKDEFTISKKTVQKAIEDIRGNVTIEPGPRRSRAQKRVSWLPVVLLPVLIIVAALGGWNFRKEISALISGKATVTTAPPGPLLPEPEAHTSRRPARRVYRSPTPLEPEIKAASLFLDEQTSLGGLFRLFNEKERQNSYAENEVHLGLFSFHAEPEHYIMFKKPFRVRMAAHAHHPDPGLTGAMPLPRYLLIREVTADGAIAIDACGKERPITRDFILSHWGPDVSWVYPYENKGVIFVRGMRGTDVIKLKQTLNEIGYSVEPTGLYDKSTFRQVMKFQGDFGLKADGIVGARTKGLLYQMSD